MDQPRASDLPILCYLELSGSLCLVRVSASAAGDPGKVRPQKASKTWFNTGQALPDDTEMLLYACLTLVAHRGRLAALKPWSSEALAHEKAFSQSGDRVAPSTWRAVGNVVPFIHVPLNHVFTERKWVGNELEQIGKAMQAWRGAGCMEELTVERLKYYLAQKPRAPGTKKKPKDGPARWKTPAAVIGTAALVHRHGAELRRLLAIEEPLTEVRTMHEDLAASQLENHELQTELVELKRRLFKFQDAKRKAEERKLEQAAVKQQRRKEAAKAKAKANRDLRRHRPS